MGFNLNGDVSASIHLTGGGGDELLNDAVDPTNEVVVTLGIVDGDIDYSATFEGQTLVGSTITVEAHYTFFA